MDSFYFVIGITLVGFLALAAALLVPVYLFLKREERASKAWTQSALDPSVELEDGVEQEGPHSQEARQNGSTAPSSRLSDGSI